jgi:hypothetical protein
MKKKQKSGKEFHEAAHDFIETRKASMNDRKKASDERRRSRREQREKQKDQERKEWEDKHEGKKWRPKSRWCPVSNYDRELGRSMTFPSTQELEVEHNDFETAIQRSISATSKGNPVEDSLIERALRASVAELQTAREQGADHEAMNRALEASIKEAARAKAEAESHPKEDAEHEEQLRLALQKSLEEYQLAHQPTHERGLYHDDGSEWSDSDVGAEEKEAFKLALVESKRAHAEQAVATETNAQDEDLQKAIEESKASHQKHGEDLERQKTEEEIVMEYVKKQSLAEEEHKKAQVEAKEISVSGNGKIEEEDEDEEVKKAIELSLKGDAAAV